MRRDITGARTKPIPRAQSISKDERQQGHDERAPPSEAKTATDLRKKPDAGKQKKTKREKKERKKKEKSAYGEKLIERSCRANIKRTEIILNDSLTNGRKNVYKIQRYDEKVGKAA